MVKGRNAMYSIQVKDVSKSYGEQQVLRQISLNVEKGQIVGLLGPSGSGKTTLVNAIIGMIKKEGGTIEVLNHTVPNLAVMREIGYMSQEDALYQDLSGIDNLVFFSQLNGFSRKKSIEEAKKSLELVSLLPDKDKKVLHYSGGMKRRLSLAIALMNYPKLLVLDEPTVGIDPVLRQVFWQEFERRKQGGTSILVTTHVMDEAEKCDKLAMIREGQIIAFDHPEKIKQLTGKATLEEAFIHLSRGKVGN